MSDGTQPAGIITSRCTALMGSNIYNNDKVARGSFGDFPLDDADQCVKCGLCLPHCPTYKLSLHEGDSPRGRIALMQGLAQNVIAPESSTNAHLDGCLVCRACEPVCPAQVPYGRLIDHGRQGLWRAGHRPGWLWKSLAFFRRTPVRIAWLTAIVRIARITRVATLARLTAPGRVARAARFIERTGAPSDSGTYAVADSKGSVALFLGCIARPLDHSVLHASIRVLNAMLFNVDVCQGQGCCGAMDAHAGDADTARELARNNIDAFSNEYAAIISTASGCGVQLQDYPELAVEGAQDFSARVHDVMHFIHTNIKYLPTPQPLAAHVVVHTPCTLKNGMREGGALQVLQMIPGLRIESLRHQDCCGAAGSYLFEHVETADRLGTRLLDSLGTDIPDIFVTSNIGCALHIRRLVQDRGLDMEVVHPVELLARALPAQAI